MMSLNNMKLSSGANSQIEVVNLANNYTPTILTLMSEATDL